MTRRLILIRHAKSGWDDPLADDHARTLTDRGHAAAKAIGAWLASHDFRPDVLLSSDATRAAQTAEHILAAHPKRPTLRFVSQFYHAAPDTIADVLLREAAQTIAIVGHNPGIGMLAQMLVLKPPTHHRFDDYPTCATTVIDFDTPTWIQPNFGTIAAFITPRDLT